jgi:hypothetical protein
VNSSTAGRAGSGTRREKSKHYYTIYVAPTRNLSFHFRLNQNNSIIGAIIMTETSSLADNNNSAPTAKRHGCCLLLLAGIVLVFLLICFAPYWLEYSFRRGREQYTRSQIGKNSLFDPDPRVLQELVEDQENASKVTAVEIGELSGPHFTAEQFQALRRLPHLRTVRVMYADNGDAVLANIQGMTTIEELSFHHAGVTAEGTRYLISFPHLKELSIDRVDDEMLAEIKDLQKTLPNCKIHWHPLEEDEREMIEKRKLKGR